jgi:hypothetical protein
MIYRMYKTINGFCVEVDKSKASKVADILDETAFCGVTQICFPFRKDYAVICCSGRTKTAYFDTENLLKNI